MKFRQYSTHVRKQLLAFLYGPKSSWWSASKKGDTSAKLMDLSGTLTSFFPLWDLISWLTLQWCFFNSFVFMLLPSQADVNQTGCNVHKTRPFEPCIKFDSLWVKRTDLLLTGDGQKVSSESSLLALIDATDATLMHKFKFKTWKTMSTIFFGSYFLLIKLF